MKHLSALLVVAVLFANCTSSSSKNNTPATDSTQVTASTKDSSATTADTAFAHAPIADAATIMARPQVPILCYHHIRPVQMPGKALNGYEVTVENFKAQMKALHDSGYHTILPDQLYDYLTKGKPLPEKPVMLTYDDTDEEQFSIAKPEMDKYGFKGVYYIMTISIGRPRYMTKEQIKQLADEGHAIGSHTWDHHRMDKLKDKNTIDYRGKKVEVNEWDFQLTNTKKQLEELTGKTVDQFAFPFGIWSKESLGKLEERGYKLAFQLSDKRDSTQPLMTVRRMIVAPTWSAPGMIKVMKSTFK